MADAIEVLKRAVGCDEQHAVAIGIRINKAGWMLLPTERMLELRERECGGLALAGLAGHGDHIRD